MEKAILQVDSLKKSYGTLVAVNGVSLSAGAGEIVGLLGPNGAGKTTLLRAVSGLLPRTGSVHFAGGDISTASRLICRLRNTASRSWVMPTRSTKQTSMRMKIFSFVYRDFG